MRGVRVGVGGHGGADQRRADLCGGPLGMALAHERDDAGDGGRRHRRALPRGERARVVGRGERDRGEDRLAGAAMSGLSTRSNGVGPAEEKSVRTRGGVGSSASARVKRTRAARPVRAMYACNCLPTASVTMSSGRSASSSTTNGGPGRSLSTINALAPPSRALIAFAPKLQPPRCTITTARSACLRAAAGSHARRARRRPPQRGAWARRAPPSRAGRATEPR